MEIFSFKQWLEVSLDQKADAVFGRRDKNLRINFNSILSGLGLPTIDGKPQIIKKGSLAIVYQHPHDPRKIIKLTGDMDDARNLWKAQKLNSPNIVKVYAAKKLKGNSAVLVADKIDGKPMPYASNIFLALIHGDFFDDATEASQKILNPRGKRMQILQWMGKDDHQEYRKLSELFATLGRLEKIGIDMFDFTDNIIDNGPHYVIIDLGQ